MFVNKKTKKILIIVGLSVLTLIICFILVVGFIFHELFVKPSNEAKSEARSRASYLLQISDKTALKKVGEAGMSETIDNNNHCYTYVFQGINELSSSKSVSISLLTEAGYVLEQATIDSPSSYKVVGKASDGWTTQLQVLGDTALVNVAENVIDNPVSTKPQSGQVLVSGQVCNI